MARKTVYECDRCHGTAAIDENTAPDGWLLFKVGTLPAPIDLGANLKESLKAPQHLCDTCSIELLEWFGFGELKVVQ